MTVGLLHPGDMGATIGACCVDAVVWCSAGRSADTARRATDAGLTEVASLDDLVACSDVIVSVCPPGEAVAVAGDIASRSYDGIYVDANAIAPATARTIAERFDRFVDGGIVGPPARAPGTTRMYLSGPDADRVASLWEAPLEVRVVDGGAGAASALKMAYATWTKVSGALLLDVRALARVEGVEAELLDEWAISQPGTADRSEGTARGVSPKAWRFVGEMEQMVLAHADAGLPDGFPAAAAEICRRLAGFKGAEPADVDLDTVLASLVRDA